MVRVRKFLAVGATVSVVVAAALFAGSASSPRASSEDVEYVNPGAPLARAEYMQTGWFERGDERAVKGISPSAAAEAACYRLVIRFGAEGPLPASSVIIQPGQLVAGERSYDGYTFKYGDRVAVVVTPTNAALDLAERLATEDATTTTSETHLWQSTTVRGFPAAYRKSAVQKWESGDENVMPAVLEWSEPHEGTPSYVTYAILGDMTLGELKTIANQLRPSATR